MRGEPAARRANGIGRRLESRLRALDRRLGIERPGGSEWVWLTPALTLVGTTAMVMASIQFGDGGMLVTVAAGLPLGLLCGAVLAALSIGFMTPGEDEAADEGGDHRHGADPPAAPWPIPGGTLILPSSLLDPPPAPTATETREAVGTR
jgi:hypothetical protein